MDTTQQTTKENYDPCQSRIDLCREIQGKLEPIYKLISDARQKEMNLASNEDVSPLDFDNLRIELAKLFKLTDDIMMEAGAEDEYGYMQQGKSFD